MNSSTRAMVTAAVAGGYFLGRTRKAKLVFAIGSFVAGRRFGLTPTALAAEGLRQVKENPQFADLRQQVSGELLTAVRSAASASANRRFSSLAGALRERGRDEEDEREPEEEAAEAEPEEADDFDEQAEEAEDEREGDEEAEDEEDSQAEAPPRRRQPAQRAASRQRAEPRKGAAKKAAPSKKKPSKKAGPAKSADKKTADKKTAPGRSQSHANRRGR